MPDHKEHNDQARNKSEGKTVSEPSVTLTQVIRTHLSVFAQVYREELTEELIYAFEVTLQDLRPDLLVLAFRKAMKEKTFRPTPAEVRDCYQVVAQEWQENQPKPPQLEEPPLTPEEREIIAKSLADLGTKLQINRAKSEMTPEQVEARRAELQKQKQAILKTYPKPDEKKEK
jgi:hypothetical protein